jgi:hypothetical protein
MIYQVIFKDFTLDYKIINSPISQIWVRLTEQSLINKPHISSNQWTTCWPTEEYILDLWSKIETLAKSKGLSIDGRTQSALNQLHKEFHVKGEAQCNNDLEELNTPIHSLEHALRLIKSPWRWNSQVGFFLEPSSTEPITDKSLYKYWDYNPTNNDLCLGYHTLGKNLYQCWRDNDAQLIRDGMLRPQITISTEVNLIFTRGNPIFDPLDKLSNRVDKWIEHNGLINFVNRELSENQYLGTPLLGKYIGNLTCGQINQAIQQGARAIGAKLIDKNN